MGTKCQWHHHVLYFWHGQSGPQQKMEAAEGRNQAKEAEGYGVDLN
jgi:hypothetical protein